MDEQLSASDKSFQHLMDTAPVMIWVSDTDKRCIWFNQPWLEFTGRVIEQELGDGWTEGVHPGDLERCLEIYTTHFDKRLPFRMEYRLRRADGEYRWILDNGVPRTNDNSLFLGYIGSCIDIKQVELGLAKTMRSRNEAFDALDRVGAMMAHEFKNVLMGIHLFLEAIRPAVGNPAAVLDLVGQAQAAVAEGTTIVGGLLAAVQGHPGKLETIHVNEFIDQSRAILRGAAGAATSLIEELTADPDEVVVDSPQFLAALLNLVSNCRDAMPEGGTVTISTKNMTVRPETLDEPDLVPGRYIVVAVGDTGVGMDERALEHAFEPFFTTKDEGTGIGLSRVRAFARKAGGIGRITSAAGKGTTVRLYLPENAKRPS